LLVILYEPGGQLPTTAELRSAWTGETPVPTRAKTKGRLASPLLDS